MERATIFCNTQRLMTDNPICFGVRFDDQLLPIYSVVVGFLLVTNGGIQELTKIPWGMNEAQRENLEAALRYARGGLKEGWAEVEHLEDKLL